MPTSLEVNNPEQLSESIFCYSPRTLAAMEACSNRRQKKAEEKQVEAELSETTDEADTASEAWSTEANGESASATAAIGADGRMMLLTMLTMASVRKKDS